MATACHIAPHQVSHQPAAAAARSSRTGSGTPARRPVRSIRWCGSNTIMPRSHTRLGGLRAEAGAEPEAQPLPCGANKGPDSAGTRFCIMYTACALSKPGTAAAVLWGRAKPTAKHKAIAVAANRFQKVRSGEISAAHFMISIACFSGSGCPWIRSASATTHTCGTRLPMR